MLKFNLGPGGFYMADVGTGCTLHGSEIKLILGVSWSGVWLTLLLQYGECRLGRPEVTLPIPHTALRRPASGWGHPQSSASCIVARVLPHSARTSLLLWVQLREGALSSEPEIASDTLVRLSISADLTISKGS